MNDILFQQTNLENVVMSLELKLEYECPRERERERERERGMDVFEHMPLLDIFNLDQVYQVY